MTLRCARCGIRRPHARPTSLAVLERRATTGGWSVMTIGRLGRRAQEAGIESTRQFLVDTFEGDDDEEPIEMRDDMVEHLARAGRNGRAVYGVQGRLQPIRCRQCGAAPRVSMSKLLRAVMDAAERRRDSVYITPAGELRSSI